MNNQHRRNRSSGRREFLKRSGSALASAALASAIGTRGYAGESHTIKVALVGCGGRGTGAAANALSTQGPVKLWAVADVFQNRAEASLKNLLKQFPKQIDVPPERRFLGLEGYRKAIDALEGSDVVILATPPAFRPIHLEYAVARNRNVFMEKSFAVDAPGVRRVLRAGQLAQQRSLKIAGGLMSRHYPPLEEAIRQLHAGMLGEIITCWAYRMQGPVGYRTKQPNLGELAHQIQHYSNFTWLNGTFALDHLIHNLDVCCWVKDAWPVSAQGQGGRQVRTEADQMFDHHALEFTFADGTRMLAQGRHIAGCWGFFGDIIHGAKGCAILGEGVPEPRIYKGHNQTSENLIWKHNGPATNPYQVEHDLLFAAIRENQPYNESQHCAYAAMTGILGRMAAESGKVITWDEAFASTLELAPGLEHYTLDSTPPVMPDAQGRYPVAMPGMTRVL